MCLGETVKCASSADMEEVGNETVTTLLILFSKHGGEVLSEVMIVGLYDQCCAPFFRSIHLSVSRSMLSAVD